MSMFLGQPPTSRWYRSRLSATRTAPSPAYQSAFCLSALPHLMMSEGLSLVCADAATARATRRRMIKPERAEKYLYTLPKPLDGSPIEREPPLGSGAWGRLA